MKKTALVFCAALALLAFRNGDKTRQVSGKVLQKHEYCGGAAAAPEDRARMEQATPLAGKKCYVRRGNTNHIKDPVVATFISDSAGNFMIHLPPGEYCVSTAASMIRAS